MPEGKRTKVWAIESPWAVYATDTDKKHTTRYTLYRDDVEIYSTTVRYLYETDAMAERLRAAMNTFEVERIRELARLQAAKETPHD